MFPLITAVLSILVIMKSASYAINAIIDYAKKTGISEYLIGFLVVSIGTTLPDLSAGIFASLSGQGALILGDVIGSNILDVTVVLGIAAVIARKVKVHGKIVDRTMFTTLFMVLLPLLLGLDGMISRLDGMILLTAFLVYLSRLLKREGELGKVKKDVKWKNIWKDMFVFVGSLIALLLSARWLVISALRLSYIFNIPVFVMGLVFVAIGNTTPELMVQIKAVMSGHTTMGFGNILGAVVANSTLVIGISSIINPILFDKKAFMIPALFAVTAVYIGILFIKKKEVTWQEGIALFLIYATFLASEIFLLR
ncbi:MAG: sodium:calcium antiporter [Candidatus Woesearchaeota archaeon]|nr:sodium:calcium antiporter [Candidatus Woesearchaeota archaeon]MDP7505891.1 sodium:calcium antiporter [Candidatus Woesearchaeota archaeon]MDP7610288.1 sodium:calcium antiporter [Candidatus Woesearchaeota archaeon]